MSRCSIKRLGIVGVIASIVGVTVPVLLSNPSSVLAQSSPRNSAVTTGAQSPAIGSNNGNVYNNYYNTMGKEKSPDPRLHLLIGRWKGSERQALVDGQLIATGYIGLLESGLYNYYGELSMPVTINGRLAEVIHLVNATGTWKLDGNKLAYTLTDIKSRRKVLKQAGQPDIDLSSPLISGHSIPTPEDFILRGSSQEYEIVKLTQSTLKMRGKNLKGIEAFYEGTRQ